MMTIGIVRIVNKKIKWILMIYSPVIVYNANTKMLTLNF
jgi:hypothetical protein